MHVLNHNHEHNHISFTKKRKKKKRILSHTASIEAAELPAQVFSSNDRLRRVTSHCQNASNEQSLRFSLSSLISRLLSPRCS